MINRYDKVNFCDDIVGIRHAAPKLRFFHEHRNGPRFRVCMTSELDDGDKKYKFVSFIKSKNYI